MSAEHKLGTATVKDTGKRFLGIVPVWEVSSLGVRSEFTRITWWGAAIAGVRYFRKMQYRRSLR